MSALYRNTGGDCVHVLQDECLYITGTRDISIVLYVPVEKADEAEHNGPQLAMEREAFHTIFKEVRWTGGVDIYSYLHQYMGRSYARTTAESIEAELLKKHPSLGTD